MCRSGTRTFFSLNYNMWFKNSSWNNITYKNYTWRRILFLKGTLWFEEICFSLCLKFDNKDNNNFIPSLFCLYFYYVHKERYNLVAMLYLLPESISLSSIWSTKMSGETNMCVKIYKTIFISARHGQEKLPITNHENELLLTY